MKTEHPTPNIQHPTSNGEAAERRFDLEERMLGYSARIIALVDGLPSSRSANHVGGQLLRSGTSPYLHHGEVEASESLNDFVHKLKVCLKELRESWRALRLLQRSKSVKNTAEVESLIDETQQLIRIFFKSIRTAQSRGEQSPRIRENSVDPDVTSELEHWMLDVGCWMLDVPPAPPAKPVSYSKPARPRKR